MGGPCGPDPILLGGRLLHLSGLQNGGYWGATWLSAVATLQSALGKCLPWPAALLPLHSVLYVCGSPPRLSGLSLHSVCPGLSWLTVRNQQQPFYSQECPVGQYIPSVIALSTIILDKQPRRPCLRWWLHVAILGSLLSRKAW